MVRTFGGSILAQKTVRKKMTETKTKYKSYKIQGRTVNLIPRKDGRFNLQIEGQRGAAGSTAVISVKESKELIERLADFPLEEKEITSNYDEDGILTNKDYDSLSETLTGVATPAELILQEQEAEWKNPAFLDPNGVKPEPKVNINIRQDHETGETLIDFEGAGFSLKYNPEEIRPFTQNMETGQYDSSILDTEVEFNDPEIASQVSQELGITGRKPKLREVLETKEGKWSNRAATAGTKIHEAALVTGGAANLVLDWATDLVIEQSLKDINGALADIQAEARKDILLGKPIGFINEYGPMLVARKASAYYSRSKHERQAKLGRKRSDYLQFAETANKQALLKYNAPAVERLKKEKLEPLQEEYKNLVAETETITARSNEINQSMKKIKESPWMKMTDSQIAVQKRRAAKEKNTAELSRINKIEQERKQLQSKYEKLRQESEKLPAPAVLKSKINTLVMKKKAVEAEIQNTATRRPEGYKDPITTNNNYGRGKITALFGQRLHTVILNSRTEAEKTRYYRGL
jgi:murein DD-endopeptidase MepM/ murein hydrolase activator NlpD